MYRELLPKDGKVHLKTDSPSLFEFTMEVLEMEKINIKSYSKNIYAEEDIDPLLQIQTYYERMHLKEGRNIHYVSFDFN